MYSNKEWIFKEILDCGLADLDLLDRMEDFDLDIIETLKENGNLSLAGIFEECFAQAKDNAAEKIKSQVEGFLEWLRDHKAEIIKLLCCSEEEFESIVSSDELFAEFSEQTSRDMLDYLAERGCEDEVEAEDEYWNIYSSFKKLTPSNDFAIDFNYQSSCLYIEDTDNRDLYFAFFGEELSEIESKLGLCFCGR